MILACSLPGPIVLAESPVALSVDDLRGVEEKVEAILPDLLQATVAVRLPRGGNGSGVIVDKQGLILTAGHVSTQPGQQVRVFLADGREVRGTTLGRNGIEDSGMIKIETEGEYPFVEIGKSKELKPGEFVIALGHPGGYRKDRPAVVRVGRVSRLGFFVQTDAVLVGGDSGGPLFDLDGKLVGIHSRINVPIYDNRHVPIDRFTLAWDRLASGEEWALLSDDASARNRPWLGVEGENDVDGFRVTIVNQSSPAAKAGLLAGDLITHFDRKKVNDVDSLVRIIGGRKIGDEVELQVLRDAGETVLLKAKLGKRPATLG